MATTESDLREAEPEPVSDFDRRVYRGIAAYAFDEAEAWPSQQQVADDVGCCRESVNRAVGRLLKAGWLRISETRFSWRTGWAHNVYELLAKYATSWPTIRRITRRAHARKRAGHTNTEVGCSCRVCRHDSGGYEGPSPVHEAIRRWRPRGPAWRSQLAGRLRRQGLGLTEAFDVAFELPGYLSPLPDGPVVASTAPLDCSYGAIGGERREG